MTTNDDDFRAVAIKAIAFCARLQHAEDVPEDIVNEAREVVRMWNQYQAQKSVDRQRVKV